MFLNFFFNYKKKSIPKSDEDFIKLLENENFYGKYKEDSCKKLCYHYTTEIVKDLTFTNIQDLTFFDTDWFFKYYSEFDVFNKIINNQYLKSKIFKDVNKIYIKCYGNVIGYIKTNNHSDMIGILNLENYK